MICPLISRVSKPTEFELERKFPGSCKTASRVGDKVEPESIVAHCEVSAGERLIKIAHVLGVGPSSVKKYLLRKIGDRIYRGEIIARRGLMLGLGKKEIHSPADGVIHEIDANGDLLVKFLPTPIRLVAGAAGEVTKVGQESIFIKTKGIQVKGYAGGGKERAGLIKIVAQPNEFLIPQKLTGSCAGNIIVGGSFLERATIEKALTLGVHGIVVGGINHRDFLSLGVDADIGISVLVTEGFGKIPMGKDIFESLKRLENHYGFVSGEAKTLLIPQLTPPQNASAPQEDHWKELTAGDIVRIFRTHSEEIVGKVEAISEGEEVLNSGVQTQIATVKTVSGKKVNVPAANLEIIQI